LAPRFVQAQRLVCERFGVPYVPTGPDLKLGLNLDGDQYPINGLREPLDPGLRQARRVVGVWSGERVDSQVSFSALEWNALHAVHLADQCPGVLPYLGLPPGWRFLTAPGYEDVWQDTGLLVPE
jgi:hypothetical protein